MCFCHLKCRICYVTIHAAILDTLPNPLPFIMVVTMMKETITSGNCGSATSTFYLPHASVLQDFHILFKPLKKARD